MIDGLGQNGGGGGAIAGGVGGLGSHFLDQLRAHVFKLVAQLDFFGYRHAVLGDDGRAEGFLNGHVAAFGAQSHLNGVGKFVHAAGELFTGFNVKKNFFSRHGDISS